MNNESKQLGKKILLNWIFVNGIGWMVGFFGVFVLSYQVANIFYPKETNLILGLCIGACVGYAQYFKIFQIGYQEKIPREPKE